MSVNEILAKCDDSFVNALKSCAVMHREGIIANLEKAQTDEQIQHFQSGLKLCEHAIEQPDDFRLVANRGLLLAVFPGPLVFVVGKVSITGQIE